MCTPYSIACEKECYTNFFNRELCGETLPPDRHVKASLPLVRCEGFVLPESFVMSGLLERVAEFETREDDVIVAGFPRSGE